MEYICTNEFPWPEWYVMMDNVFPLAASAEIEDMLHSALCSFQYQHLCWASKQIHGQVVLFFSMPLWFVWSCSSICCLRLFGMTICLPLSIMPSITSSSSLYDQ